MPFRLEIGVNPTLLKGLGRPISTDNLASQLAMPRLMQHTYLSHLWPPASSDR